MSSTEAQIFTLPEAAKALGLSVKTLRKRAQQEASEAQAQGREPAAFLHDHKGGQRWVVTANLLDLWRSNTNTQGTPSGTPEGSPLGTQRLIELEAQIKELQQALEVSQLKADHHESIATERAARLYELQQSVLALTGAVRALTESKTEKRRWWQKQRALENPDK